MTPQPTQIPQEVIGQAPEDERAGCANLVDLAPVGLLLTDRQGVVLELNRAAADLLATDRRLIVGRPLVDSVPADQRKSFGEHLLAAVRARAIQRWTAELDARGGARLAAEVTVAPAATGRALDAVCWVIHDVSERLLGEDRQHELASEYEEGVLERTARLEEERAFLEAVIENIPAGVLLMDRTGTVLRANAEALRMIRRGSIDAPESAQWRELEAYHLDGRRLEPDGWPMSRTLATGEVVRGEKYEVVVQGRHVILEISTAPVVSASGRRTGGLAVLRDVTIREQTERAERDFVTNAAHELQSPLAAIVSAVEVLQAGAKDGPQRDVFLTHIDRAADRLARLVRALLILARTQIGVEAPRDELVALRPLLEEVREGLTLASSVELEVDCPDDLAVLTNRELVEQAVTNLAENAAKYTPTGRVVLAARELPDRAVEITVTDTGSGIAAAERPKVFERFYRGDPDGSPGFGLGLAIVRAVADALGGELELDSTVGAGTIVRLRLPNAAALVG